VNWALARSSVGAAVPGVSAGVLLSELTRLSNARKKSRSPSRAANRERGRDPATGTPANTWTADRGALPPRAQPLPRGQRYAQAAAYSALGGTALLTAYKRFHLGNFAAYISAMGKYLWVVGVVLVTVASAFSTVGIITMKKSFGDSGQHKTWKDKLMWAAGLSGMILAAILDFTAFGFAAQSLIAPLGSVTLLFNVILSPIILGEKVAKSDWVAALIIGGGCTLAISFGNQTTEEYEFDQLMGLYHNIAVIIYLPVVFVTVVVLFICAWCINAPAKAASEAAWLKARRDKNAGHSSRASMLLNDDGSRVPSPRAISIATGHAPSVNGPEGDNVPFLKAGGDPGSSDEGFTDGAEEEEETISAAGTPQAMLKHIPQHLRLFHGFCFAAAGGLAGSCSVLFGKSIAELIKPGFTKGHHNAWEEYQTYLIIVAMVCTLLVQMKGLNSGLAFHPAVFIVPVYQSFWIMGSIVGGSVYFKEFDDMKGLNVAMFCIGVLTCVLGVFILTYFRWDEEMEKHRQEFGLDTVGDASMVGKRGNYLPRGKSLVTGMFDQDNESFSPSMPSVNERSSLTQHMISPASRQGSTSSGPPSRRPSFDIAE